MPINHHSPDRGLSVDLLAPRTQHKAVTSLFAPDSPFRTVPTYAHAPPLDFVLQEIEATIMPNPERADEGVMASLFTGNRPAPGFPSRALYLSGALLDAAPKTHGEAVEWAAPMTLTCRRSLQLKARRRTAPPTGEASSSRSSPRRPDSRIVYQSAPASEPDEEPAGFHLPIVRRTRPANLIRAARAADLRHIDRVGAARADFTLHAGRAECVRQVGPTLIVQRTCRYRCRRARSPRCSVAPSCSRAV